MANIFDSSNDPKYSQETFVSWDSFAFKSDDLSVAFPLSSYAVKFCAPQFGNSTGTVSSSRISLDAVKSGLECQITAGSTATNSWALGNISGLYLTLTALCTETLDPWWRGYWGQTELGFQLFHRCTESVTDGSRWVDWTEGLLGQTGFDGKAEGTNPSEAGNRSKHFGWLQKMSGATEKNFFQWLRFKWIGAWKIWLLRLSKISSLGGCYKATVRWAMSIKNKRKKY